MLDKGFSLIWVCILVQILGVEFVALRRKRKGDTASENVWWLLGRRGSLSWWVLLGFWAWLTVHFFLHWGSFVR